MTPNRMNGFIFIMILMETAGQIVLYPPNCSSVCGLKEISDANRLHVSKWSPGITLDNSSVCVENAIEPIVAWNRSARDFMGYIGMNDEKFGCPMENSFTEVSSGLVPTLEQEPYLSFYQTDKDEESILSIGQKNLSLLDAREILVEEPDNIAGHCTITSYRGVMRRSSENQFVTDWLASALLYNNQTMVTEGTLFSLQNQESGSSRSIRVPRNTTDNCAPRECTSFSLLWLPASTFNTSVSVTLSSEGTDSRVAKSSYSMFARFTFNEIPGVQKVLERLKDCAEELDDVRKDSSPSNLAILCLPIVMAIPPLSLLESASDAAIAWYAFATDILAALPLMIKGVEMILVRQKASPKLLSTLGIVGEKFGIFEMWYIRCNPPAGQLGGDLMVSVALWIMVASTYVEFLFWRKMRYRQGRLGNFGDIAGQLPEMEEDNMAVYDTDSLLVKFFRGCFEGRRKYFILFSVILTIEFCVLVTQEQRIRIFRDSFIVDVMMAITLIVFRAVFAKRLHQFVQWKFWAGMVLGFITGPIYLLMHTFESVRKSDKWEVIADGCNVGFGFLALIFIFC